MRVRQHNGIDVRRLHGQDVPVAQVKATIEVPAPASGVLEEILVAAGNPSRAGPSWVG